MTSSRDRRRIRLYTLQCWWYSRGPWFHIGTLTVLWLAFTITVAYATYPWLERAVIS